MRVGTGLGAFIAPGAAFQIEHQQILCLEQSLLHILTESVFSQRRGALILLEELQTMCHQRLFDFGKLLAHV